MTLTATEKQRYARHLSLPEIGATGQSRLKNAKVLVIGAGGLGSPRTLYLAAAGVWRLGLVDHDVVDLSHLQRQGPFFQEGVSPRTTSPAPPPLSAHKTPTEGVAPRNTQTTERPPP